MPIHTCFAYIYLLLSMWLQIYVYVFSAAFWLQEADGDISLAFLNLSNTNHPQPFFSTPRQQETLRFADLITSTITLDPTTGELWISNGTSGGIFVCTMTNRSCEEVVNSSITGMFYVPLHALCFIGLRYFLSW